MCENLDIDTWPFLGAYDQILTNFECVYIISLISTDILCFFRIWRYSFRIRTCLSSPLKYFHRELVGKLLGWGPLTQPYIHLISCGYWVPIPFQSGSSRAPNRGGVYSYSYLNPKGFPLPILYGVVVQRNDSQTRHLLKRLSLVKSLTRRTRSWSAKKIETSVVTLGFLKRLQWRSYRSQEV